MAYGVLDLADDIFEVLPGIVIMEIDHIDAIVRINAIGDQGIDNVSQPFELAGDDFLLGAGHATEDELEIGIYGVQGRPANLE